MERPDSEGQRCEYYHPRLMTLPECLGDGHYMCIYCQNWTGPWDEPERQILRWV